MIMKISANKFVSVIYDLNVGEGDEIELMEKATPEAPLDFVFGSGSMLPAFEDKLAGLKEGDKFEFTLDPSVAYGEYNEEYLMKLPKSVFEIDGEFDADVVREGNIVPMVDSEGNRLNGSVMEVGDAMVEIDFNNPLAGETLHFSGEVVVVRDVTEADLAEMSKDDCKCTIKGCGSCTGCY
jgi:FKBP-type peptidyl-prolyl cis-trans isomerase SlyD